MSATQKRGAPVYEPLYLIREIEDGIDKIRRGLLPDGLHQISHAAQKLRAAALAPKARRT